MAFVSATAAASPASATLFLSVLFAPHGAGSCVFPQRRQPFLAPFHAAKGPNSVPVVLESKAKGKKKKDLAGALDVEIREAQEYLNTDEQVEEIPANFPFKISDEKGTNVVTLKRTYQGEHIEVVAHMPSLVTGDEPDHDRDGEDKGEDEEGDDNEEDEGQKPEQSSIPLTVTISKGDAPVLEFTCTAYPDEVLIDSLSVRQPSRDDERDLISYEGPDFNDLDENLQRAFHKYLELRGISPMTTNFLHEYMINKDSREYLLWLRKLKDFFKQ